MIIIGFSPDNTNPNKRTSISIIFQINETTLDTIQVSFSLSEEMIGSQIRSIGNNLEQARRLIMESPKRFFSAKSINELLTHLTLVLVERDYFTIEAYFSDLEKVLLMP